jgi:hypothetical protein
MPSTHSVSPLETTLASSQVFQLLICQYPLLSQHNRSYAQNKLHAIISHFCPYHAIPILPPLASMGTSRTCTEPKHRMFQPLLQRACRVVHDDHRVPATKEGLL